MNNTSLTPVNSLQLGQLILTPSGSFLPITHIDPIIDPRNNIFFHNSQQAVITTNDNAKHIASNTATILQQAA